MNRQNQTPGRPQGRFGDSTNQGSPLLTPAQRAAAAGKLSMNSVRLQSQSAHQPTVQPALASTFFPIWGGSKDFTANTNGAPAAAPNLNVNTTQSMPPGVAPVGFANSPAAQPHSNPGSVATPTPQPTRPRAPLNLANLPKLNSPVGVNASSAAQLIRGPTSATMLFNANSGSPFNQPKLPQANNSQNTGSTTAATPVAASQPLGVAQTSSHGQETALNSEPRPGVKRKPAKAGTAAKLSNAPGMKPSSPESSAGARSMVCGQECLASVLSGLPGSKVQQQQAQENSAQQQQPPVFSPQNVSLDLPQIDGPAPRRTSLSSKGQDHIAPAPELPVYASDHDKFGLAALANLLELESQSPQAWFPELGIDLESAELMALNGSDYSMPSSTLATPWTKFSEIPGVTPAFKLPRSYMVSSVVPAQQMLQNLTDETLFYIFYSMPKDAMQEAAAVELTTRNWRYHKTLKLWLTKDPLSEPVQQTAQAESGIYVFFDPQAWEKVKREYVLHYPDIA